MIVDEKVTSSVRLGRNRFLAGVGTLFTAAAATWWFPEAANATVPNGCHGYDECSSCSGSTCTRSDCEGGYYGCESGGQCWNSCAYLGSTLVQIQCCDWGYNGGDCICRATIGPGSNC